MAVVNSSSRIIQTLIRPTNKEMKIKNHGGVTALTTGGTSPQKVMETKKLINLEIMSSCMFSVAV